MAKAKIGLIALLVFFDIGIKASTIHVPSPFEQWKSARAIAWADSVMQHLSLEEQIGQLIMIRAHTDKSQAYKKQVRQKIKDHKIGGVCFFQGGPLRQAHLTRDYQSVSKVPLLVATDGEWGLGMRLDSTLSYPYQMTLGAIQDNHLINMMGKAIGKELKAIGVNMNFAPVLDVNNNPQNPVINFRSFGENPRKVFKKGIQYAHGLQSQDVIACGKHFPGHGDTDQDSHHTLPVIHSSAKEMRDIHMLPFRKAANEGIGAIMTSHIHVPALDNIKDHPASLSKEILKNTLRKKYNYHGLLITDALEMAGVSQEYSNKEIAVKALSAGTDILLMPKDLENTISAIKASVKNGELSKKDIANKCRKMLIYKFFSNRNKSPAKHPTDGQIKQILNKKYHKDLIQKLYKKAITLLKNDNVLPIENPDEKEIAVITSGKHKAPNFVREIRRYASVDNYHISTYASRSKYSRMVDKLSKYDLVITGMLSSDPYPSSNYGFSQRAFDFTEILAEKTQTAMVLFGNPYALKALDKPFNSSMLIIAYQNNKYTHKAAARALFSATEINSRLPVSIDELFEAGDGINLENNRLETSSPYFMNINAGKLKEIDSIIRDGIKKQAYPGAQVLIAKEGKIFYHKSFGYHTYNQIRPVKKTDLYDVASLTKIAATTLAVMRLQEKGLIDIDRQLKDYIPELKNTNKADIVLREMMAHQARLHPWIPFYLETIDENNQPLPEIYHQTHDSVYSRKVAENLYIRPEYKDSIFSAIKKSELRSRKKYKYSDLGFYLLSFIIRDLTNQRLNRYVEDTFYNPMGLSHITFNPLEKFDKEEIVPTEDDNNFRHQLIHGYVHDPGAAMLGGISGHAGLFSNASDLAALMQMLLNHGNYAGKKILDSLIIEEFTKRQFPLNDNRRGIGFDKPLLDNEKGGPSCQEASKQSFGHSGFTGTYAWADPKYDLVYIFLSNRIYPKASNRKLITMDIRTKIQKVIYEAIKKKN